MFFNDGSPEDKLDDLALLASQDYNLGNAGNWFFSFRTGLKGLRSRLDGMLYHRRFLYDWGVGPLIRSEHHIATILFCMDSAVECTVFALNALGQAVDPAGFRDVKDPRALRLIAPKDVTGAASTAPMAGWRRIFPGFQQHLTNSTPLLTLVVDNHDVSKHRRHSFTAATFRNDPPPGFFERLGLGPEREERSVVTPMATILVPKEPKLPWETQPYDPQAWTTLEAIIADFGTFVQDAMLLAQKDAEQTIQLPIKTLR